MSPKYAVSFFLLAIVCSAGFTSGFNSERLQSEDTKHIENQDESKTSDLAPTEKVHKPSVRSLNHPPRTNSEHDFVVPDHPVEPHTKRVKVLKRRHVRGRRDRYPELPSEVQDIFSTNQVRRSITPNDYYAAFQSQQQQPLSPWQFQGQGFPSASPFGNPGVFHNTFVPNGPQVNNYYSPYGLSPANPNPLQQQGITPWNFQGFPYPLVFFIPIQWCPPNTQVPNVPTGELPSTGQTVDDRFGFPEEQTTVRRNTTTGISLDIATPPRRPTRPLPEIQRNPSGNTLLASGEGKIVSQQAYSPPMLQRPQAPVTSAPTNILEGSNSISAQSPQVGANVPPCLWAIVSCCQRYNRNRSSQENCFDNLGCSGAFYDTDPCDGELAKAAEKAAQTFYNSG